ncbi:uncharacterized protein A4U43_C07F23500 [Asparagus officinalis]|uniref:protein phosphatase methylesterase-1 n=1 Tax=Asparagus officinalis TaxID=4686 RepID=A0A5P1EEE4_ASPOF|nr:uncharacterized protein A4U43_C07F23500 [Asparagus officinalis]
MVPPATASREPPPLILVQRLSFALTARKIKEKARVVAMDLRGHGKSSTDNDVDLSIDTLCNDVLAVLKAMYGDSPPAIILVGHRRVELSLDAATDHEGDEEESAKGAGEYEEAWEF